MEINFDDLLKTYEDDDFDEYIKNEENIKNTDWNNKDIKLLHIAFILRD